MSKEKITIPAELQQVCREIAEVAKRNNLTRLSGKFVSYNGNWNEDVHFEWDAGRHGEDSNDLKISSSFRESIQIKEKI